MQNERLKLQGKTKQKNWTRYKSLSKKSSSGSVPQFDFFDVVAIFSIRLSRLSSFLPSPGYRKRALQIAREKTKQKPNSKKPGLLVNQKNPPLIYAQKKLLRSFLDAIQTRSETQKPDTRKPRQRRQNERNATHLKKAAQSVPKTLRPHDLANRTHFFWKKSKIKRKGSL
jgi:hypothetical protein